MTSNDLNELLDPKNIDINTKITFPACFYPKIRKIAKIQP